MCEIIEILRKMFFNMIAERCVTNKIPRHFLDPTFWFRLSRIRQTMVDRSSLFVLFVLSFFLSCSVKELPSDLFDDLSEMEEKERITVGWIYQDRELTLIVYRSKPEIQVCLIPANVERSILVENFKPIRIDNGTDAMQSPNGLWITYRTRDDELVLADANGKIQRTLFQGNRVVTPLYWSPNSRYLMYVEKGGVFDLAGLQNMSDAFYVMIYRLRDGERGPINVSWSGYPHWNFRWIRIPETLPMTR